MSFFAKINARQQMGIAALIMGFSVLISRFMGLFRDKVISWQFGASGETDLYFAAFILPDFLNYLLAGGYLLGNRCCCVIIADFMDFCTVYCALSCARL